MNAAFFDWLQETRRTYIGNAAAQRDFRVQFRGNRSAILFGIYLALLIIVAWFKYTEIEAHAYTIAEMQRELRDFYLLIVMLLGGVVAVVAPGLAATAVVAERQRRSLDLIFSGPVPPRYYLVGKMIASFRYTWMLLILSLPVTAACVVLGGASWSDVLTVYGLLSIHGLLYAAIGLMMSTICPKPVTAVLWTYLGVGAVAALTTSAAMPALSARTAGIGNGAEAPFLIALSPFSALYAVGTHTTILGLEIPNALLGVGAVLLAVRLCLLGAGAVLSEGRETANLRISWAFVVAASAYGIGRWMTSLGALYQNETGFQPAWGGALGIALFWLLSPLVLSLPNLATYGRDGNRRERPNGWFSPRHILDGTPAGSLPYIVGLVTLGAVGLGVGLWSSRHALLGMDFLPYLAYTFAFWGFFWAVGRWASAKGAGLRAARTMTVSALVLTIALPLPILATLRPDSMLNQLGTPWDFHILRPVLNWHPTSTLLAMTHALVLAFGATLIFRRSEQLRTELQAREETNQEAAEPDLRDRLSTADPLAEGLQTAPEVRA